MLINSYSRRNAHIFISLFIQNARDAFSVVWYCHNNGTLAILSRSAFRRDNKLLSRFWWGWRHHQLTDFSSLYHELNMRKATKGNCVLNFILIRICMGCDSETNTRSSQMWCLLISSIPALSYIILKVWIFVVEKYLLKLYRKSSLLIFISERYQNKLKLEGLPQINGIILKLSITPSFLYH